MTADECIAARRLVGWGRPRLAQRAGVSQTAILNLETRLSRSRPATVVALRTALEGAGVEFTDGDAPGVRLRRQAP
jgi:DNA-binding XRE family transcriptional regulator